MVAYRSRRNYVMYAFVRMASSEFCLHNSFSPTTVFLSLTGEALCKYSRHSFLEHQSLPRTLTKYQNMKDAQKVVLLSIKKTMTGNIFLV